MIVPSLAAVGLAVTGNAVVVLASAEPASAVAPWLQGGGSAAAVAGLVYVARMVIKGDLVPRAVADRENETAAAIRVQAEHARELQELAEAGAKREKTLEGIANEAVKTVAEVGAELRWWRDQREKGRTVTLPRRSDRDDR